MQSHLPKTPILVFKVIEGRLIFLVCYHKSKIYVLFKKYFVYFTYLINIFSEYYFWEILVLRKQITHSSVYKQPKWGTQHELSLLFLVLYQASPGLLMLMNNVCNSVLASVILQHFFNFYNHLKDVNLMPALPRTSNVLLGIWQSLSWLEVLMSLKIGFLKHIISLNFF